MQDYVTYQISTAIPGRTVRVFDQLGNLVPQQQGTADRFQAPRSNDDTYYVSVGGELGTYQLTAEIIDDTINEYGFTAKNEYINRLFFGNIEQAGDIDVFKKLLINGVRYSIRVIGESSGLQTTLDDARLTILDQAGNVFANQGDTVYEFDSPVTTTIVDPVGNGRDRIDVGNSPGRWIIDLRPGRMSRNFVSRAERKTILMAYHSEVEDAFGQKYRDLIIGNYLDNKLVGRNGNDVLDGRQGDDILLGGAA